MSLDIAKRPLGDQMPTFPIEKHYFKDTKERSLCPGWKWEERRWEVKSQGPAE